MLTESLFSKVDYGIGLSVNSFQLIYSGEIVSALAYLAADLKFWLKTWKTVYNWTLESFLILADYAGFAAVYRETNVWVSGTCVFWRSFKKR